LPKQASGVDGRPPGLPAGGLIGLKPRPGCRPSVVVLGARRCMTAAAALNFV